jgi:hypothetical protein
MPGRGPFGQLDSDKMKAFSQGFRGEGTGNPKPAVKANAKKVSPKSKMAIVKPESVAQKKTASAKLASTAKSTKKGKA